MLSLVLGLLTLVTYNGVARNGFVSFDDPAYITANPHVRSGLNWNTAVWAFRSTDHANWHPLTWLSHALDYQLFHLNPAGHHYVSLLLHVLNAILLFWALVSLTGSAWRSLWVAAVFAVHPINVESVAWAAERKNVLCTSFFLLALIAYAGYARHPGVKRYLLVSTFFVFALMSKPMVVTFPFVLLLLDYWPLARTSFSTCSTDLPIEKKSTRWLVIEKLPWMALAAVSAGITMVAQRTGGAVHDQTSFLVRAANAVVSYAVYLRRAFWPSDLAIMYPFREQGLPGWEILSSAILLLFLTAAIWAIPRKPYLAAGWFWFLGTLVPVIGLVRIGDQAMADRYAYIPLIGIFIAVVWGIADLLSDHPRAVPFAVTAAVLALVLLAGRTRVQIGFWHDSIALWSHALDVTTDNFVAHDSLGADLLEQGEVKEAEQHFRAAVEINPRDPFGHLDLGVCQKQRGNLQGAIANFESVLELTPDPSLRSTAFSNLGSLYRRAGDYPRARENYGEALRLVPDNRLALTGMGLTTQRMGDVAAAVPYYERAVRSEPSDVGYALLGQALETIGRNEEAKAAFQKAQRLTANSAKLRDSVAYLLSE